jgi:hypothetical protein
MQSDKSAPAAKNEEKSQALASQEVLIDNINRVIINVKLFLTFIGSSYSFTTLILSSLIFTL